MGADAGSSTDFRLYWDRGIRMATGDERFTVAVGGRLYVDWGWIGASGLAEDGTASGIWDQEDGVEARMIRAYASGVMHRYIRWKLEGTVEGGVVSLADAWMELTELPYVGNVRVGHFKEPFSLGVVTDSRWITFMERALPTVFAPARNFGLMAHNACLGEKGAERMSWAVGVFRSEDPWATDGNPVRSDGGYGMTARVTGLPWYADEGRQLVHVGVAHAFKQPTDRHMVRLGTGPEAHFVEDWYLDTSYLYDIDNVHLFGAELAGVYGPFHAQMEYIGAAVDKGATTALGQRADCYQDNPCFGGFYVQAGYFITGESRPYDHATGSWARLIPKKNVREDGGWGALEVATRYSYLDLDDERTANSARGELNNWTIGVNWYLNPNARIMANYIRSCLDRLDTSGAVDIFMMRFQFDF
ncbi:MAG TPA: porin [Phycisphaerae bacterium]|nr:porin [Phycisphaerae bacterium]